ncbi:MAG: LysR family transcriptional regulator [Alphaproteobacteria bacterium]
MSIITNGDEDGRRPFRLKLTGIDLNLFVAFEAIYAERNLTRAADILSVTQPAVSNALAGCARPSAIRCSRGAAARWSRPRCRRA